MAKREEASPGRLCFISGGEREVWGRPLESASDAGVEPDQRASGHWQVGLNRHFKGGVSPVHN
jgi:hypothetical protein